VKAKEWVGVTEAARRKGWNRKTVYRAIRRGRLPAEQTPGGHYRIRIADLDRATKVEPAQPQI